MNIQHINSFILNIKLNLKPLLYQDKFCKRMIKEMNKKAASIGMSSSFFISPDGSGLKNRSTAIDLLMALVTAFNNETIANVFSKKEKKILCKGKKQRTVLLESTLFNKILKSKHNILGGKTGSWIMPTRLVPATYNLSIISEIDGYTVAAVIVNAQSDLDRFSAMEELLDIAQKALHGADCKNQKISLAMGAAVCKIIPDSNSFELLFSQNPELQIVPASLSKFLTLMVVCDYIKDFSQELKFSPRDMVGGSGNLFVAGDIITVEDAFYAALLPSSNSAVYALSRMVGEKITKKSFHK